MAYAPENWNLSLVSQGKIHLAVLMVLKDFLCLFDPLCIHTALLLPQLPFSNVAFIHASSCYGGINTG